MEIRPLNGSDLSDFHRLVAIAGWNQSLIDLRRLLVLEPRGCFAAEQDGKLVGTLTTTTYSQTVAWIGMVLVEPAHRGQGIATALMRKALEFLAQGGVTTIKLDATAAGRPVYSRLGFVDECRLERWKREDEGPPAHSSLAQEKSVASLYDLDRSAFGADRRRLLETILNEPGVQLVTESGLSGKLQGFVVRRPGRLADYVGPLLAESTEIMQHLLERAVASPGPIIIDAFADHPCVPQLLIQHGFLKQRDLIRMRLGHDASFSRSPRILAIAGPEVG